VVVFVPLGLLQGVVGQFFAALSLTLAAAVLLSLGYALFFIPNAAARFLEGQSEPAVRPGRLAERYRALLRASLERPRRVAIVTLCWRAIGAVFYLRLETGFLPEMDEGGYVIDYWTPEGTSLAETDRMVHRMEEVVAATPEVAGFARRTGAELGLFATEQKPAILVVKLKPPARAQRRAEEVIEEQRATLRGADAGDDDRVRAAAAGHAGDLEGNPEPVEVKIFGDDLAELARLAGAPARAERLEKIPGLVDLVVPQRGNPELDVAHRPYAGGAGRLHPSKRSRGSSRRGLLGQVATSFRRGDRLIDVRVRFPDARRFDLDWIREFPLTTAEGGSFRSRRPHDRRRQGETQLLPARISGR
jgi:multidrug efflux pump subunit AcrB